MQLFHPTTIDEAVGLLAAHDEARCLAGGQTLVAMLNLGLLDPPALVSLRKVDGLDRLTRHADGSVTIGATVTQAALAAAALPGALAVLSEAAQQVAHPAIRNFGTVGGALCHADPAADLPPAFVAAQARLTALGQDGERSIPRRGFLRRLSDDSTRRRGDPDRNPPAAAARRARRAPISNMPGWTAITPPYRSPRR